MTDPSTQRPSAAGHDADRRADTHTESIHADDAAVHRIVSEGPGGAFAVAGLATAIVLALYVAFYFFAYLPRGVVQ